MILPPLFKDSYISATIIIIFQQPSIRWELVLVEGNISGFREKKNLLNRHMY